MLTKLLDGNVSSTPSRLGSSAGYRHREASFSSHQSSQQQVHGPGKGVHLSWEREWEEQYLSDIRQLRVIGPQRGQQLSGMRVQQLVAPADKRGQQWQSTAAQGARSERATVAQSEQLGEARRKLRVIGRQRGQQWPGMRVQQRWAPVDRSERATLAE